MAKDDHGRCPHCDADLNGGLIWEHFFNEFVTNGYWLDENGKYTRERRVLSHEEAFNAATDVARNYGATQTEGRWGRQIGETRNDRIYQWHCPDCKGTWLR